MSTNPTTRAAESAPELEVLLVRAIRWALSIFVGLALALLGAPAWAHVEVEADNPQAGATNVTLTFTGEAESTTAGIASERVYLPAGITPAQVHLKQAPTGWTFTPETDGFTVAGAALPKGTDAVWSVVIDKLPADATELLFKTIETYGDGEIVRWIDEPQAGQPEPDHPAPSVKLAAAAPGTAGSPTPAATTAPTSQPPVSAAEDLAPAPPESSDGGSGIWWLVGALVVVAAAVIAAFIQQHRRRQSSPPTA
jgi:uncharacterized protein YcnI